MIILVPADLSEHLWLNMNIPMESTVDIEANIVL